MPRAKTVVKTVPMSPEDKARYEAVKNNRSWGNTRNGSWGFGNSLDAWEGTLRSPLDVVAPIKADPEKNPWGY